MQHFSTDQAAPRQKLSYWNDAVCDIFADMETIAQQSGDFDASLDTAPLGGLYMANARSAAAKVNRTERHVARSRDHQFFLHMQLENSLTACQQGHVAELDEGDFVLCDSALPYSLAFDQPCSTLVLGIPAKILKVHLPSPELAVGIKISGAHGMGQTLQVMIRSIWSQMDEGFEEELGQRVAQNLLDVMATACSTAQSGPASESAVAGSRRIQIKRYIEANLRDPELSARKVAGSFRISTRYLHMLFSVENETVSNYILRRRIEECAKQMSGYIWRGHTITEIAFGWGFNNTTHFARVFRNHYGMSPRDFRNVETPAKMVSNL